MNSSQNQYLRQVEQLLIDCPKRDQEKILDSLEQEMEDFLCQIPECTTYEEVVEVFGDPQEVAQQLLSSMKLKKHRFTEKNKQLSIVAVLAILSALILGMAYWVWTHSQEYAIVTVYESEPIIVSDEEFEKRFGKAFDDFFEEEP